MITPTTAFRVDKDQSLHHTVEAAQAHSNKLECERKLRKLVFDALEMPKAMARLTSATSCCNLVADFIVTHQTSLKQILSGDDA